MIPIKNSGGSVEGILCVQRQMAALDAEKISFLKDTVAITAVVLVLMILLSLLALKKKLLNPLSSLTLGVKEISGGNLDKKLDIKTDDELQTLAENFNAMTDELKNYMANLTKVTAENERIATELDVAKKNSAEHVAEKFSRR